jgi:G3E family GTPase
MVDEPNTGARIPLTLLTGFLGSGKTTVLNHLLKQPELGNAAVLINEFGEIGLDHDLVEAVTENLVLLQNGCLCCTIRGDLIQTLDELYEERERGDVIAFDRLVIETTGLADPAPIIHTLLADELLAERFRIDGVIVTVDAATGDATLDRQIESVKQAAVADRILLTKRDLASPNDVKELEKRLRALNPSAPILPVENGVVDPVRLLDIGLYRPDTKTSDVQNWLAAESYPSIHHHAHGGHHHGHHHHTDTDGHDVNRHDERVRSVCLTIEDPLPAKAFDVWLKVLMRFIGPDVLRLKAIVHVAGMPAPFVLHGIQHLFHPPVQLKNWPKKDRRTRIVLIVRDLDDAFLQEGFTLLTEAAAHNGRQRKRRSAGKSANEVV